ncbi:MAG: PAS domain-containing protein [Gaiellaceae bacterium]
MSEHATAIAPPHADPRARDGPRPLPAWLVVVIGAAALAGTAAAVYTTAVSDHAPSPAGHAALTVVVCLSFVGTGLLALRRSPYIRFALLLVVAGFAALLGALHDANDAVIYATGVITANLFFAVIVHALLAFPKGRLGSRTGRFLVVAAYVDVLAVQALAVLFDPLTRWHSDHPRNVALVYRSSPLSTALEELEAAIAVAIALAVVGVLTRRSRVATPAARRLLMPVVIGGKIALLFFSVGLVLAPLSSDLAVIGIGLGMLASLAIPAAFLGVLLHGRLSRAAVGELLVELGDAAAAPGLEDALRRALGDPSLALARKQPDGGYRDDVGEPLVLPGPGEARVATPIEHQGEEVGMLIHDRVLRTRPELLDAVSAAAGFALANERALETLQRMELRNSALLDAIPDLVFRVSRDGTYLDVQPDDSATLPVPAEDLIGMNIRDLLPPRVAEHELATIAQALDGGAMTSAEYELKIDGVPRHFELRMVPSGEGEVVTIVRDFTEQRRNEREQRRLAEEQAALRRVATLVAADIPPEQVFQNVTEEICRLLGIPSAVLERFESDKTATVVARYGERVRGFELGTSIELREGLASTAVLRTGLPARIESYAGVGGEIGGRVRGMGVECSVAVPIKVAGATWGALVVPFGADEPEPPHAERRLQAFAELVSLGLASAHARDELEASRLRIVQAGDAERRRLERNLHDGAQQRLVGLAVALRLAEDRIHTRPEEAHELLRRAAQELGEALNELRELAQGIHPAVLTERGLEAALEVLAARAPLPVALDVRLPERLPEPVEAAAYYVASEALANVVKHAGADSARVRAQRLNGRAVIEIEDDGAGGADAEGSGLFGLRDRVETLDGSLWVESARGRGTLVHAELPVDERSLRRAGRDR